MAIFTSAKKADPNEKIADGKSGKQAAKTEASMKDLYGSKAPAAKPVSGKSALAKKSQGKAYRILVKPLVTEKVTVIGALNQYGFEVDVKANKIEIAKAIEEVYGVKPQKVNIIAVQGKKLRYGKIQGRRKNTKKAYVTLPEGKAISVYEGV